MNNKVMYENILTLTKSLVMLHTNGAIEASNDNVKKVMEKGLQESMKMQVEIYQAMKSDGFYQVANVKESEIQKVYDKLTQEQG